MRILLTNDDGVHGPGLAVLQKVAAKLSDDVWTVAPETDQSGLAHSLTLSEPLRLRQYGEKQFALRGTPTDCVIMAAREVLPEPPDLVLSGINSGANLADDVTYSGTVAAAIEGTLQGVRSIALSQCGDYSNGRHFPWEVSEEQAVPLLQKLIDLELPRGTLLNVNFPCCKPEDVAGVQVTAQGKLEMGLATEKRVDGRGLPYYWLCFQDRLSEFSHGSDLHAVGENFVSVTPLKLDLTDYAVQEKVKRALGA
ncbi:5'/3'-nucleotidase SurE [Martelella mediterranea]|uniref:5'-nucleotidase SurE n=1 Tax=Martelella mediterranea TaxID=293089 RepID=A0A4R3NJC7_9HYPH|nr:5'/3'-nucleotidase SurE [Martelella mediterranea]TCT34820.1 5'-nucleotidase /3'-nucleotidase /exopolyphosphatase [Martelella mediterranea]